METLKGRIATIPDYPAVDEFWVEPSLPMLLCCQAILQETERRRQQGTTDSAGGIGGRYGPACAPGSLMSTKPSPFFGAPLPTTNCRNPFPLAAHRFRT